MMSRGLNSARSTSLPAASRRGQHCVRACVSAIMMSRHHRNGQTAPLAMPCRIVSPPSPRSDACGAGLPGVGQIWIRGRGAAALPGRAPKLRFCVAKSFASPHRSGRSPGPCGLGSAVPFPVAWVGDDHRFCVTWSPSLKECLLGVLPRMSRCNRPSAGCHRTGGGRLRPARWDAHQCVIRCLFNGSEICYEIHGL
jgi:hypothetical protein